MNIIGGGFSFGQRFSIPGNPFAFKKKKSPPGKLNYMWINHIIFRITLSYGLIVNYRIFLYLVGGKPKPKTKHTRSLRQADTDANDASKDRGKLSILSCL